MGNNTARRGLIRYDARVSCCSHAIHGCNPTKRRNKNEGVASPENDLQFKSFKFTSQNGQLMDAVKFPIVPRRCSFVAWLAQVAIKPLNSIVLCVTITNRFTELRTGLIAEWTHEN